MTHSSNRPRGPSRTKLCLAERSENSPTATLGQPIVFQRPKVTVSALCYPIRLSGITVGLRDISCIHLAAAAETPRKFQLRVVVDYGHSLVLPCPAVWVVDCSNRAISISVAFRPRVYELNDAYPLMCSAFREIQGFPTAGLVLVRTLSCRKVGLARSWHPFL